MHVIRKTVKGASFLSASEIVNQGCSLARNVILARFLTKADFGVAALLGLIITLFELTGKIALGQQLVQSKRGDDPSFLGSIHFTQLSMGTISAFLILLCAWPLSHFVAGRQYLVPLMVLASIPFLNGLTNLGLTQFTRQLHFGPSVLSEIVPQVVTTLAAWPLALYFRDYRAVLAVMLGRTLLYVAMTHVMAERRFAPRFNAHLMKESLRFGWPLLVSGFVQIGNFQGDSMVVAARYALSQLGEYSVALTMAMTPGFAIMRICQALSLPLLSEVQSDAERFGFRYARYVELMAFFSCCVALGMLFCGESLVVLLFGGKYAGVGALACLLFCAQAIRFIRVAVGTAAMARGDTVNNLISSSWRLSGLALAVAIGSLHLAIAWFALAGFVGEIISLTAVVSRLAKKQSIKASVTSKPTISAFCCIGAAAVAKWLLNIDARSLVNWPLLLIAVILSAVAFAAYFPELWTIVRDQLHKVIQRRPFGTALADDSP
jgi:O-antigen/teichoic acid export membrane protein